MARATVLLFLLSVPWPGLAGDEDSIRDSISLRAAEPPIGEIREEMIRWRVVYLEEMAPVREHWSRVVEAIHGGHITHLPLVCPDFQRHLREVDRQKLLTVADPIARIWLGRGLDLLDGAASRCRRDRFFDLGFRLYKARHVIQTLDRRLERYR